MVKKVRVEHDMGEKQFSLACNSICSHAQCSSCYCVRARDITSVVCSIIPSKGIELFIKTFQQLLPDS